MSDSDRVDGTVELPNEAVEKVIKELETGMRQGKRAHSHDEVRPSSVMMAKAHKDAYHALIEAHPRYELKEPDSEWVNDT